MHVSMGKAGTCAARAANLARRPQQQLHQGRMRRQATQGMPLAARYAMAKSRPRVALLLIDFMNPLDFTGGEALARPAVRAATRSAALKRRLARAGVPAIYCNDNFGHWESDFEAVVETCRARGGAAARLVELLGPAPGDRSILKPRHSAFFGTPLDFLLEELRIERLVLTGLAADNCIMFTAHDAYLRKFALRVPSDCVASERAAYRRQALAHMARVMKADVRPSGRA
jgi:nicotinamidase-related amidase